MLQIENSRRARCAITPKFTIGETVSFLFADLEPDDDGDERRWLELEIQKLKRCGREESWSLWMAS
ncbi:hypothetical protein DY000_02041291 [Brassica cretica]|uniref:Uncharacterized protein n=1 Tax=Brassica cretica TaxID=69181 RepID=A0ABQ7BDG0_BRACR|nr:hypothetical protein DY000_02041291 [Brassica cretica]